jgi:hypothetical protein
MAKKKGPEEVPEQVDPEQVEPAQLEPAHVGTIPSAEKVRMPAWAWALIGAMAATIVLGGAYIAMSGNRGPDAPAGISSETSESVGEASETLVVDDAQTAEADTSGSSGSSDQGSGSDPAPVDPAPSQPAPAQPAQPAPAQPSQPAVPHVPNNQTLQATTWTTIVNKQKVTGGEWMTQKLDPGNGRLIIKLTNTTHPVTVRLMRRSPYETSNWVPLYTHKATDTAGTWTSPQYAVYAGKPWWLWVQPGDEETYWELTVRYLASP